jgi:hypothetical protein
MPKTVAIVQSNYVPWKGYFDLIGLADEFILYDDMQYTRRDWRNRNRIKTAQCLRWLTIPVEVKGKYFQTIRDTRVANLCWAEHHWRTLAHNYAHAPRFDDCRAWLEELYRGCRETHLSQVNHRFLSAICSYLGVRTRLTWSGDYRLAPGKTERLVDLCIQAGATTYLSGPAAKDYVVPDLFAEASIQLAWMDYSGYAEYPQLYGPFEHGVSILDLIVHCGPDARHYLKCSRHGSGRALSA